MEVESGSALRTGDALASLRYLEIKRPELDSRKGVGQQKEPPLQMCMDSPFRSSRRVRANL